MEIVEVPIDELKPSEYNPRKLTEKEKNDLMESLKRFNFVEPIVVNSAENRKNIIIGGHQRYYIAKELGYKTIPVVYVNIPDIKKEQELNLRLNKNLGEWDYDLLANFDEELLKDIGWESEELDKIFQLDAEEDDFDAEAEYQKIEEPKAKYGDIYQLGKHRLMCGDATKREDVEKLMNGEKADMIFTDPPFAIYGSSTGANVDDKMIYPFFKEMWKTIYFLKPIDVYICCDWRSYPVIKATIIGYEVKDVIVWDKKSGGLGSPYRRRHEFVVFAKEGRNEQKMFARRKMRGKKITDDDVWEIRREKEFHNAQKPVELCSRAIKNSTNENDIVIDLFGGSGSTLIACEQLHRHCYMMEIDPKYCDVIVQRWEKFTNQIAQKL